MRRKCRCKTRLRCLVFKQKGLQTDGVQALIFRCQPVPEGLETVAQANCGGVDAVFAVAGKLQLVLVILKHGGQLRIK